MKKNNTILEAKNLVKTYKTGFVETKVLRGINLEIGAGEFLTITGRSGSGKSTLLYLLSLLDRPTSGNIIFEKCDSASFSEEKNTSCRLKHFGFVFQDYALLPELSTIENVMLPMMAKEDNWQNIKKRAMEVLEQVELSNRINNYPSQLSGGEKQRVAIARAVANKPKILFADEPTANLDSKRAEEIINLLFKMQKEGIAIVLVTHEKEYIDKAEKVIELSDGIIVKELKN